MDNYEQAKELIEQLKNKKLNKNDLEIVASVADRIANDDPVTSRHIEFLSKLVG